MCTCGAPRAEHSEDALKAAATAKPGVAKVGSGDIGTKWSDRDCVDCENFELDMSPGAAFGTCNCRREARALSALQALPFEHG